MSFDYIISNLRRLQDKVRETSLRYGRKEDEVQIMAVGKTRSIEEILAAHHAGISLFGENRVQETQQKYNGEMPALHLIGHLQRNKIATAAKLFSCVQSIDKLETAKVLNEQAKKHNKTISIMLQLNVSGEASKHGCPSLDALQSIADVCPTFDALKCTGLMTVGPHNVSEREIANAFGRLRKAKEALTLSNPDLELEELSMGMSSDYTIAIAEGASMIRLGSAIFSKGD